MFPGDVSAVGTCSCVVEEKYVLREELVSADWVFRSWCVFAKNQIQR